MSKTKHKDIENIELKFVRGDGKAIENITTTLGALFDLYAKDLGYTRPESKGESNQLQRLIVLATKWIPKDHHDWEEFNNMGWEEVVNERI